MTVPSNGRPEPEDEPTKEERDRELDRMAANIRWLKAWGHLRMRPAAISRDQALELAREVSDAMGREIKDVLDLDELTARGVRTPCIYNVDPSDCWIAYIASSRLGLFPSDIVLIDKKTGAVRYIGSAHDEG